MGITTDKTHLFLEYKRKAAEESKIEDGERPDERSWRRSRGEERGRGRERERDRESERDGRYYEGRRRDDRDERVRERKEHQLLAELYYGLYVVIPSREEMIAIEWRTPKQENNKSEASEKERADAAAVPPPCLAELKQRVWEQTGIPTERQKISIGGVLAIDTETGIIFFLKFQCFSLFLFNLPFLCFLLLFILSFKLGLGVLPFESGSVVYVEEEKQEQKEEKEKEKNTNVPEEDLDAIMNTFNLEVARYRGLPHPRDYSYPSLHYIIQHGSSPIQTMAARALLLQKAMPCMVLFLFFYLCFCILPFFLSFFFSSFCGNILSYLSVFSFYKHLKK